MEAVGSPVHRPLIALRWERAPLKERLARDGAVVALASTVVALAGWLTPSRSLFGTHQQLWLPPCTLHLLTGRPCPSCGATTSFALMARGDVATAFRANFFGPFLFSWLVIWGVIAFVGLLAGRQLKVEMPDRPRNAIAGVLVISFILYGAVRFILWKP